MGLFKLFKRKKPQNTELQNASAYAVLLGDSQKSPQEMEILERQGINIHMIEDSNLNTYLEKMSVIENNGKSEVDLNAFALRIMATKLIRASWVDPIDVDIAQLELERLINRVEMDMDEDTYEYGGTNLLEAIAKVIQTAWSDAKGGRKAKLLKVTPRVFEISMPTQRKNKEGLIS